ncbi:hypothetical protein F5Y07DRAFT_107050 [Xylaria sp. FL0933]|nr:hypothetical protein F5Y07DRAFT_107050 [Xylaria sp. FL0933]
MRNLATATVLTRSPDLIVWQIITVGVQSQTRNQGKAYRQVLRLLVGILTLLVLPPYTTLYYAARTVGPRLRFLDHLQGVSKKPYQASQGITTYRGISVALCGFCRDRDHSPSADTQVRIRIHQDNTSLEIGYEVNRDEMPLYIITVQPACPSPHPSESTHDDSVGVTVMDSYQSWNQ